MNPELHAESEKQPVITPSPLKNGNRQGDYRNAPRCGAKTRMGTPCKGPGMPNGRCRMHGGCSTGPKTKAGIERIRAARTKHGYFSAESKRDRREVRQQVKMLNQIRKLLDSAGMRP